jgi:hypothetical protein
MKKVRKKLAALIAAAALTILRTMAWFNSFSKFIADLNEV